MEGLRKAEMPSTTVFHITENLSLLYANQ